MTISASTPARVMVLLITVAMVLVLLLATGVGATVGAAAPGGDQAFATHRVAAGDTLWDIAAVHTAAGEDVRRTVHDIRVINGLDGSLIVPGQVLRIPASG